MLLIDEILTRSIVIIKIFLQITIFKDYEQCDDNNVIQSNWIFIEIIVIVVTAVNIFFQFTTSVRKFVFFFSQFLANVTAVII